MAQVLIFKDTKFINSINNFLDRSVPVFQEIYNEFKNCGVTVTAQEIQYRIQIAQQYHTNGNNNLTDFMLDKLLDKAGMPNFNGVPVSRKMLRTLIDLPNIDNLSKLLLSAPAGQNGTGYDYTLLEITNDVVSLKGTAHASIEDKYTYYTKTDKGLL